MLAVIALGWKQLTIAEATRELTETDPICFLSSHK